MGYTVDFFGFLPLTLCGDLSPLAFTFTFTGYWCLSTFLLPRAMFLFFLLGKIPFCWKSFGV